MPGSWLAGQPQDQRGVGGSVLRLVFPHALKVASIGHDGSELFELA